MAREGKPKFQAIPLPRGAVIRPVTVRDLIGVLPWEQPHLDPRTPLLVVSGGWDCRRCVGWLRGFPAQVACSPRTWHGVHRLVRGPVDLYLSGPEGMLWGSLPGGRCQSLVDAGVLVPDAHTTRYDLAFPNVRSHNGGCGWRVLEGYYGRWCKGWSDPSSGPAAGVRRPEPQPAL